MTTNRYDKMAAECYERVLSRSRGRYDIEDVKDELRHEIVAHSLDEDAVDALVEALVRKEDERRSRAPRGPGGQLDLLTGEPAAASYEVVWRLLGGQRVQARWATRGDHLRKVEVRKENRDAVDRAFKREQREFDRLQPYYVDDTTTYPQAIAAYVADNPTP